MLWPLTCGFAGFRSDEIRFAAGVCREGPQLAVSVPVARCVAGSVGSAVGLAVGAVVAPPACRVDAGSPVRKADECVRLGAGRMGARVSRG